MSLRRLLTLVRGAMHDVMPMEALTTTADPVVRPIRPAPQPAASAHQMQQFFRKRGG